MKHTDTRRLLATYPLTIGSPFGDIRLSYELATQRCADCGKFHAAVNVLHVPDGLSKRHARAFLALLPEVLEEVGDLLAVVALFGQVSE